MDKINQQELQSLVRQPVTEAIEKSSLSQSSALMLAGMLDLAAAQAKYELTESEIEFWKRQVAGYPETLIEQFFSEHLINSSWMPQFHQWHAWLEARAEQERYENKAYWNTYRAKQERVREWRDSPEYAADMAKIKGKLEALLASRPTTAKKSQALEIPLAFTPEKEREILTEYASRVKP